MGSVRTDNENSLSVSMFSKANRDRCSNLMDANTNDLVSDYDCGPKVAMGYSVKNSELSAEVRQSLILDLAKTSRSVK